MTKKTSAHAIRISLLCALICLSLTAACQACSMIYYVDQKTRRIYVANNEDYWYDTRAYIQIMPKAKQKLARLWYGWDDFAQGGVNEAGLFFDGAVVPEQTIPEGSSEMNGNLGDELLANCRTVDDALNLYERRNIALKNAHVMFGDSSGNAAVLEWVDGEKRVIHIANNTLIMTNFLLSDTTKGNYPCYRYRAIADAAKKLRRDADTATLKDVGNLLGQAVQLPSRDQNGRAGGTLYSTFIDISDMEFVLVYKLDNSKIIRLDLRSEFSGGKKRKIALDKL